GPAARLRGGKLAALDADAAALADARFCHRRRRGKRRAALLHRMDRPRQAYAAGDARARSVIRGAAAARAAVQLGRHRPLPRAGRVAVSVAIVDYGSGNLHSAAKAFERAARESGHDQPITVTSDPAKVARADRVVLPGVGAFADCRRGLDEIDGM